MYPSPQAHWCLGLPHFLERSDSVPRNNHSPEAICAMRERRPRSVAESSARLRRVAMSCTMTMQDEAAKQEPKHHANMLRSRPLVKATMESDVLAVQKTSVAESLFGPAPQKIASGFSCSRHWQGRFRQTFMMSALPGWDGFFRLPSAFVTSCAISALIPKNKR